MKWIQKNKILIGILLAGLLFRLVFFVALAPWNPENVSNNILVSDASQYHQLALGILENKSFAEFGAFRTPIYPMFLSFVYLLFGQAIWLVVFLQIIMDLFIALLIFSIGKIVFDRRVGLWASLIYALSPLAVSLSVFVGTEVLFSFLFAIFIYLFVGFVETKNIINYVWLGLVLGLATLTRPISTFLIWPLAFFVWLFQRKSKYIWVLVLVVIVSFFVVLSFWQIRNYKEYNHYSLSTIDGYNLLNYNVAPLNSDIEGITLVEARAKFGAMLSGIGEGNPFIKSEMQKRVAIGYIFDNPVSYFKFHLKGSLNMFLGTAKNYIMNVFGWEVTARPNQALTQNIWNRFWSIVRSSSKEFVLFIFLALFQFSCYILALLGFIISFKENKRLKIFVLFFLVIILYFSAVTGVVGSPRFRYPLLAVISLFSAKGIVFLINKFKERKSMNFSNKKIVIAADIFPPDIGGPATYSKKLAEEMIKKGWQVDVICYSDKKNIEGDPVFVSRVVRSKFVICRYLKYFFKLIGLARDTDIIYAMGPVSAGFPAMWTSRILNKKLVVKIVGDYAWEQARNLKITDLGIDDFQKEEFKGKIGKFKKIESKVCKSADVIITPSNYLKSIVSGWGVADKKIKVVYNAVEIPHISKKERDLNLIISVGRLVSWKGFDTLIELMPELLKENLVLRLKIYGDGPEKYKLNSLIRQYNLSNFITINQIERGKLLEELSGAGMFILNTGYEGLPHTVLEAMTVGVPVAISNVCGNPEVVMGEDGKENGLLFEYNNKEEIKESIRELLNPNRQEELIKNAKKSLYKFQFKEMINSTEKILSEI